MFYGITLRGAVPKYFLNILLKQTGSFVPIGIGSHDPMRSDEDLMRSADNGHRVSSINLILSVLENSKNPVDIHMTGSCRDIVIAAQMRPDLFKRGFVRIFLNAGIWGSQDPMEYNVSLEPYSFSKAFEIPCDIYWAPCFEKLEPYPYHVSERANYYEIEQGDFLPFLSPGLQNYFLYMFDHVSDNGWLCYVQDKVNVERLNEWSKVKRQMWSTPRFLLSAGLSATLDGELTDENNCKTPLFEYTPVKVNCRRDGILDWQDSDTDTGVYMFRLNNPNQYETAMKNVVLNLLKTI